MRSVNKALRFPFAGVARNLNYRESTYPGEDGAYPTPMAKNVIGCGELSGRLRGGTRPGLATVTGLVFPTSRWLWPNGENIAWEEADSRMLLENADEGMTAPDGSHIMPEHPNVTFYRNRKVLAEGSAWIFSRTGDFGDFDFGGDGEDYCRAVAGSLGLAGQKEDAITALAKIGDARLYVATHSKLGVFNGEPTSGLSMLSENTGIISADAWCNADGTLFFMGQRGLYAVGEGGPMLASPQMPEDLRGLTTAILVYDPMYGGIHIFTTRGQNEAKDYFYDISNKAIWPVEYPVTKMPDAGFVGTVDGVRRVIFHCVDDAWRFWQGDCDDDGGTAVSSTLLIGPFKCGARDDIDGMLDSLNVTLGTVPADSASDVHAVTVAAYPAKSAEEAVRNAMDGNNAGVSCGTFSMGRNPTVRTRIRGAWCVLKLTSNKQWAYEAIQANTKTLGELRA